MILSLITTFVKTQPQISHLLKCMLKFISVCKLNKLLILFDFPAKLEELLNQTLSKSVTMKNFIMCKATLLVFRHCCLEIGLWSEYSRWYSLYKPNLDTAIVFYSLLTDLLNVDLPAALAAHINTVIIY